MKPARTFETCSGFTRVAACKFLETRLTDSHMGSIVAPVGLQFIRCLSLLRHGIYHVVHAGPISRAENYMGYCGLSTFLRATAQPKADQVLHFPFFFAFGWATASPCGPHLMSLQKQRSNRQYLKHESSSFVPMAFPSSSTSPP